MNQIERGALYAFVASGLILLTSLIVQFIGIVCGALLALAMSWALWHWVDSSSVLAETFVAQTSEGARYLVNSLAVGTSAWIGHQAVTDRKNRQRRH